MLFKKLNLIIIFSIILTTICQNNIITKQRVLIASAVKQEHNIILEFLHSLKSINQQQLTVDYCFIDDNDDTKSSELLNEFSKSTDLNCLIYKSHPTNENSILRNSEFKNFLLNKAIYDEYDYIFLIDSNIIINPETISHLVNLKKDIVSEIFWENNKPQVWMNDTDSLSEDLVNQLRKPGIYEVGGLKSCILMSKKALKTGLNFNKINNLALVNCENQYFCVRAVALGLELFVDTHYPALQLNSNTNNETIKKYKQENQLLLPEAKERKAKVTLAMCVKNESDKYLRQVLLNAKEYIDEAVIIDDGSTDNTPQVCLEVLRGIPVHLITNTRSKFSYEIELRKQLWEETIKTNPEWIVILDADQEFELKMKDEITKLVNQDQVDALYFRLYDFWDKDHYREDTYWNAHQTYRIFMVRYKKDFNYEWADFQHRPQHCGSFPANVTQMPGGICQLRVKHFGWAKPEDRIEKYKRYQKLDPDGKCGIKEQYDAILDSNPTLIKWVE